MASCPACGHLNPDGAKFCMECATALGDPATSARVKEERKVVTALFCDLVGFTALSERTDPEDVDAMLSTYFAMARDHIEGHIPVPGDETGEARRAQPRI
jgi:hypothetical protein